VIYSLFNSSNCGELECSWRSFSNCKPFLKLDFCIFVTWFQLSLARF